jgi:hypothetical protein
VTGQLAALLFYRSWCDRQSHLAGSQETWVRNWGCILLTKHLYARKVLSPTALLPLRRKWCSGFLSPRSGSNPRTLGPVASTLTTSLPRATYS